MFSLAIKVVAKLWNSAIPLNVRLQKSSAVRNYGVSKVSLSNLTDDVGEMAGANL
jgi:hypothetical protein